MFGLVAIAEVVRYSLLTLVCYVGSKVSFPQPLTREKERECLERMAGGDEAARAELIEHNMRLVVHIVKKYNSNLHSTEDLISIGVIGLIKGIDSFDLERGVKLGTYVARCIENEILMQLRHEKKQAGNVSLQDSIGLDKEGSEITLSDILGTDTTEIDDQVTDLLEQEELYVSLRELSSRERQVLILRYGLFNRERKTQEEVARLLSISRSYVSRIEKKAVNKLFGCLAGGDTSR